MLRQGECEAGPLAQLTLGADFAAVTFNDSFHNGQAYPGAIEIFFVVQTLKHIEQFVGILHVETSAIVLDVVFLPPLPLVHRADLDLGNVAQPHVRRDGRNVGAQQRLVAISQETLDLARSSYDLGETDFLSILDAEVELLRETGRLYPCYETSEELEKRRKLQQARKRHSPLSPTLINKLG